jgi:cell division protease FtsH
MVREYGMSERLGPVGFPSGSPMYLGGEEVRSRPFAEQTQRVIDEEVSDLLREAERRATGLLSEHRDAVDRLVDDLLAHETVDGDAVAAAIAGTGPASGPADSGGLLPRVQYQTQAAPPPATDDNTR